MTQPSESVQFSSERCREQYRQAEQIPTDRPSRDRKPRKPVWLQLMNMHGSCVCGQKVWFLIHSRSIGMEHLHFWFSLAKEKKQKNKQNTCLWLLLPASEQTFKELSGNRTWHCFTSWYKNLGAKCPRRIAHDLQENPSNVHSLVEGVFSECLCCGYQYNSRVY